MAKRNDAQCNVADQFLEVELKYDRVFVSKTTDDIYKEFKRITITLYLRTYYRREEKLHT